MTDAIREAESLRPAIETYLLTDTPEELVERLNILRRLIAGYSPFNNEPVDLVEWLPSDAVHANDYNPNSVAPPEMELLRLSIAADGYTQPIVTMDEGDSREVIDGFHRNRVGKECDDVRERTLGYLPVVTIRDDRTDKGDRIASTIRHNRARGKHQVIAMSDIVLDLARRNWSDAKISKQLGMDEDEVLRLKQITGLAEAFKDREFSAAWEPVLDVDDEFVASPGHIVGVSKGHCGGWGPVYAPYCSCGWEETPNLYRSKDQATKAAEWHRKETNMQATTKYVREGNELVRREPGGSSHLPLPDREGYTIGYWIKPSPFDGTPPWEWVITNMDVTVVTGMSSGYTFTRLSAVEAVRRALRFWASLDYDVVDPDGVK